MNKSIFFNVSLLSYSKIDFWVNYMHKFVNANCLTAPNNLFNFIWKDVTKTISLDNDRGSYSQVTQKSSCLKVLPLHFYSYSILLLMFLAIVLQLSAACCVPDVD